MSLLVREEDVPRVAKLLAGDWDDALAREGLEPVQADAAPGSDPICPACGFTGPLDEGECGDCGLTLA